MLNTLQIRNTGFKKAEIEAQFMKRNISHFLEQRSSDISQLAQSLNQSDFLHLREASGKLKTASNKFGLYYFSNLSLSLAQAAKDKNTHEAYYILQKMKEYISMMKDYYLTRDDIN